MKAGSKELFQYTLGGLIVLCFFATLILLIVVPVPEVNQNNLSLVIGALIGVFVSVVGYFFGSSMSSAKKDATIAGMKSPEQPQV